MSDQSNGYPPELLQAAEEAGIDPAVLMAQAQAGDDEDPFIIIGRRQKTTPKIVDDAIVPGQFSRRQVVGKKKASQIVKWFYLLPEEDRAELQQRLLDGGFYGRDATADDIAFGLADEKTLDAFSIALRRAAAMNKAGREITLDEVIDEAVEAQSRKPDKSKGSVVTSPVDIRAAVREAAQEVLGRGAGPEIDALAERIASKYQAMEQSARSTVEAGGVATAPPSLGSFVEDELRAANPAEADATRYVEKAGGLIEFFLNPVGAMAGG